MVNFRVTTTNMTVHFATILLLFLGVGCSMATIVDFSKETWPVMALRVAHLEPAREELDYGNHTVPGTPGLIELECIVAQSSLPSSLGLEMAGKVTGVKWILPNPKIIDEGRAYIKYEGLDPKLSPNLVITEFNKEEDKGDYTCQMTLEDESITRYKEAIHIPALDGSPIISCKLTCERNMDENCQLAGPYDLVCRTFAFYEISTHCEFQPCLSEDKCPLPLPEGILGGYMPYAYLNRPTPMYVHENVWQKGGVAGVSGRFTCHSNNRRKTSMVSLYASVSVAPTKPKGVYLSVDAIGPDGEPIGPPAPPTPKFLGSMYPEFQRNLQHVEFGCWTSHNVGNFEWSYRPVDDHHETILTDKIASQRGIAIHQEQMYGGRGALLTIEKYRPEKGGYYTCKAIDKNDYSVHSKEYTLSTTKWGPHTDMNSGKTITAGVNGSVTIRCDMLSTDTGDYFHWQKAHLTDAAIAHLSPSDPGDKFEFSNDSQTLTIHNLTPEDAGKYGCRKWGVGPDGEGFEGEVTVLVSDTPPDFHKKLEMLHDVLMTLDEAGHQLSHVVESMSSQHDHHHGHHDMVHHHGRDHQHDHGQDPHDHGQDHQDHGHDHHHGHHEHGHDHQDHVQHHQDHQHDHQDHVQHHQYHGHDHHEHGHDHHDHHVHHHSHHDHGQDHQDQGHAEPELDSSEEVD